jgi:hypothetical protein
MERKEKGKTTSVSFESVLDTWMWDSCTVWTCVTVVVESSVTSALNRFARCVAVLMSTLYGAVDSRLEGSMLDGDGLGCLNRRQV